MTHAYIAWSSSVKISGKPHRTRITSQERAMRAQERRFVVRERAAHRAERPCKDAGCLLTLLGVTRPFTSEVEVARSLFGMRSPRRFRRALVALALVVMLAGCSDDDAEDADDAADASSITADGDAADGSEPDDASTSSEPTEESPPGTEVNENEGLDDPIVAVADLTADQVVPGPGAEDTTGRFELVAETSEQLCVDLVLENAPAGADKGHVHVGAVGETGRIAIDLGLDSVQPSTDGATTRWDDVCMPLKPALIESLSVSTDAYYMQVHSPDYPEGAVRGQLHASSLFDLELT